MTVTPLDTIEGATRTAFQFGLFSVAPPRGGTRWQNGVQWEALTCDPASGIALDCEEQASDFGFGDNEVPLGDANPFVVYGSFQCAPFGRTLEEAQSRATLHLLTREEQRVEQAFWTGDLDNSPTLIDGGSATSLGTAVAPEDALGRLEDWIANNYGSEGVLHFTRGAALALVALQLVEVKGNSLQTRIGTPVVAGAGYPGTSPAGAAPAAGTSWGYASPAVFTYRSDIFDLTSRRGDLLDRGVNVMSNLAARTYLVGYDPCGTAAINFNLKAG